jgi:hypothetical protein
MHNSVVAFVAAKMELLASSPWPEVWPKGYGRSNDDLLHAGISCRDRTEMSTVATGTNLGILHRIVRNNADKAAPAGEQHVVNGASHVY